MNCDRLADTKGHSVSLGDRQNIYQVCGTWLFTKLLLCPECVKAGKKDGCGRHFVVAVVIGIGDA